MLPPEPPYPIGVVAALANAENPSVVPQPTLFNKEFSLDDRVSIVSGGNRGLGLEMAMALLEAGARAVYCFDLPPEPGHEWKAVKEYVAKMDLGNGKKGGRLEYVNADVTDQKRMWAKAEEIGDKEGRLDICVAAAGILKSHTDCLEYPAEQFQQVLDINTNGVLFTAQAAGRQMARFGLPGSIILIASMSGSITNRDHAWVSYNTSKSAVLQIARSMACELGVKGIRVNTISPGHIYTTWNGIADGLSSSSAGAQRITIYAVPMCDVMITAGSAYPDPTLFGAAAPDLLRTAFSSIRMILMTAAYLDTQAHLLEKWSEMNPLGRIGRPDEMRGVVTWLASDASTFCTGSDILVSGGHHAW